MPHEIKAYKCDYCNKVSRTKAGILSHEVACRLNPNNRYCHTCKHCDMKGLIAKVEPFSTVFYGEQGGYEVRGMYCNYYQEPIQKGEKAVYFRECETEGGDWGPERNVPCTCFYYERKDNTNATR